MLFILLILTLSMARRYHRRHQSTLSTKSRLKWTSCSLSVRSGSRRSQASQSCSGTHSSRPTNTALVMGPRPSQFPWIGYLRRLRFPLPLPHFRVHEHEGIMYSTPFVNKNILWREIRPSFEIFRIFCTKFKFFYFVKSMHCYTYYFLFDWKYLLNSISIIHKIRHTK
jgi:hypothetical protein